MHRFSLGKLWITSPHVPHPPRLFSSAFPVKIAVMYEKSLWITLCMNNYI